MNPTGATMSFYANFVTNKCNPSYPNHCVVTSDFFSFLFLALFTFNSSFLLSTYTLHLQCFFLYFFFLSSHLLLPLSFFLFFFHLITPMLLWVFVVGFSVLLMGLFVFVFVGLVWASAEEGETAAGFLGL